MSSNQSRVLIIGSGVCGLYAGLTLVRAGVNVTILEKEPRVGGLIEVALDARIKWGSTSCRYPLKFKDMISAMPPLTLFRCVTGLLIAEIKGAKKSNDINNAEDALIAFYGAPLYEYFFEEFTYSSP